MLLNILLLDKLWHLTTPVAVVNSWKRYYSIWRRKSFGCYSIIKSPSEILESQEVPSHIAKPQYAVSYEPLPPPKESEIKEKHQIEGMRRSCKLAYSTLLDVSKHLKAGITTEEIDLLVRRYAFSEGSYPSCLHYRGFPKSCCTSVNNVACHGIPDARPLENGDIVSVDVTIFYNGFHGDCCETFLIGSVDDLGRHLVNGARKCRDEAIAICKPEVPFAQIGAVVEKVAKEESLSVVPCFTGHGIGSYFHGPPDIYHCYNNYPGVMKPGMTFTVEPILAQGSGEAVMLEDGWTVLTADNGRAAQFEHTILITEDGHEILTCP